MSSLKDWIMEKVIAGFVKKQYDKLDGKKSYITATVNIILGAIMAFGQYCMEAPPDQQVPFCQVIAIPGIVFIVTGALGIWTRKKAKVQK